MRQNNVPSAFRRAGFLGALALAGAALVLAPAAQAGGGSRGGGGSHGGGGGHSAGGGGGHVSGGGHYSGGGGSHFSGGGGSHFSGGGHYSGGSRAGGWSRVGGTSRGSGAGAYSRGSGSYRSNGSYGRSYGSYGRGVVSGRGWVTHSSGSHYSSSGVRIAAHPGTGRGVRPGHGGGYYGHGGHYRPGWGSYGYFSPYWGWGWNTWGWGWDWGWAPYWSTWWWGGPWGGTSVYVSPGSVDVGVRNGRYAIVKTDVSPEEAQVYLDGKYVGAADDFDGAPDYLYLGPGTYHLEFKLPNYQTYATDLDVTRGQQIRVEQELKLEPGKSALDAFPPESKGTPLGRVFTKGGDATAQAAPRGDDGWSDREPPPALRDRDRDRDRDRGDDDDVEVREAPPARPVNRGRIKFRVTPDDAAVYMDDKYLGAADDLEANARGVVAEPGTHSITVTRPGYKTKTVEVTARAGSPVDVVVELEK